MSRVVRQRWLSNFSGPSRKDHRGCEYEAYVPDTLVGRTFVFESSVVNAMVDAQAAISRLNAEASGLVNTESLARILLRAESVASSRIEGLEVDARRLLRAEVERSLGEGPSDVTAGEVLGNIEAMTYAIGQVAPGDDLSVDLVLETNRRLLAGTRLENEGGTLRNKQNWIGGSSYNPCSVAFVPPPPEYVPGLIEDLIAFCNEDSLPSVAQAAIAHAQFETIHPFVDGNGRTGRTLVHLVLRRRGAVTRSLAARVFSFNDLGTELRRQPHTYQISGLSDVGGGLRWTEPLGCLLRRGLYTCSQGCLRLRTARRGDRGGLAGALGSRQGQLCC